MAKNLRNLALGLAAATAVAGAGAAEEGAGRATAVSIAITFGPDGGTVSGDPMTGAFGSSFSGVQSLAMASSDGSRAAVANASTFGGAASASAGATADAAELVVSRTEMSGLGFTSEVLVGGAP